MAIVDFIFISVALLSGAQSIRMPSVISDAPKLLLLSFDGFRYDYLDRPLLKPNFDFAINKGVRAKYMKSTFATKTDPNHMTMVTGLWEESHGVVSNKMYDPKYREIFWMNSSDPKWWDGDGKVEPIWITNERKEGRYSGVVNWPGGDVKYGGRLPTYSTGPYNRSIPYTDRIDAMVRWFLDDEKPMNLGLLFFEEPDRSGHLYGPDSAQVNDAIMMIDDTVGYLVSALKEADIYDKVNIILTSDHGMVEVSPTRVIELNRYIKPEWYIWVDDSPVSAILPKRGKEEQIYKKLRSAHVRMKVFKKKDIPKQWHYRNNRRIMPIIAVADDGWSIVQNFTQNTFTIKGNHGYNNSIIKMSALFIAFGPAFEEGLTSKPFSNVDLYPLMCKILDFEPRPNNGSLETVKHILFDYDSMASKGTGIAVFCTLLLVVALMAGGYYAWQRHYGHKEEPIVGEYVNLDETNPQQGGGGGVPYEQQEQHLNLKNQTKASYGQEHGYGGTQ
ncbi:ectonucleotide pyrophosphatase/phosphodiesterase family member 5-like [Branchiostoma floridae]|uniref:Ectonucleotide pyrophosphatase/phosphodiesterase family member 5-like n=1 Tax=Branchiostoma floridae TaxID=7739 RepID=A0A9J7MYX0_BRAFL|nr:ectonucleotide pyrophosphatase/phosphodiesterase family member 5-like [Branchiostoma floridae]XP_035686598.1 ectonucleotide pyrophosphatase/phosphodiesterase family member 5-like [Branchiostoma floridae]